MSKLTCSGEDEENTNSVSQQVSDEHRNAVCNGGRARKTLFPWEEESFPLTGVLREAAGPAACAHVQDAQR